LDLSPSTGRNTKNTSGLVPRRTWRFQRFKATDVAFVLFFVNFLVDG